jgi:hypothetical protein
LTPGGAVIGVACSFGVRRANHGSAEIIVHGAWAPLVLKSDNISTLLADEVALFLGENDVYHLLSPPRLPSYNVPFIEQIHLRSVLRMHGMGRNRNNSPVLRIIFLSFGWLFTAIIITGTVWNRDQVY